MYKRVLVRRLRERKPLEDTHTHTHRWEDIKMNINWMGEHGLDSHASGYRQVTGCCMW